MSGSMSRRPSLFPSYILERTKTSNWNYEITDEDADGESYASEQEAREREEGGGELDEVEDEVVSYLPSLDLCTLQREHDSYTMELIIM